MDWIAHEFRSNKALSELDRLEAVGAVMQGGPISSKISVFSTEIHCARGGLLPALLGGAQRGEA